MNLMNAILSDATAVYNNQPASFLVPAISVGADPRLCLQ